MSPVLILIFIFCYVPMYGLLISFQDWTPGMPFMDFTGQTKWVGLKHFSTFVHDPYFWRLIKNTLVLSAMNLGIAFWIPIIFSLLINEVRLVKFKKFAQTASYMPYFISSVVVAGMALSFLSSDGIINKFIMMMGGEPFLLNMKPQYFPHRVHSDQHLAELRLGQHPLPVFHGFHRPHSLRGGQSGRRQPVA